MNYPLSAYKPLTTSQSAVIRVLMYFDIFNYPLKADEIVNLTQIPSAGLIKIEKDLSLLTDSAYILNEGEFYGLSNSNLNENIKIRKKGSILSKRKMKTSRFFSFIIALCPYVRAICLSGTISKGFMKNDSDIDYFIITKPDRLWIARTFLTLFKKIFLLNSYKNFCINYFIDTDHLEIPDKNIFTATELSYLLPVYNYEVYLKLKQSNTWVESFLPNFKNRDDKYLIKYKYFTIKKWIEKLLDLSIADRLETLCFSFSKKYFDKKYRSLKSEAKSLVNRHKKYVSKLHPNNFQEKVIQQLQAKTEEFEILHNIELRQFDNLI